MTGTEAKLITDKELIKYIKQTHGESITRLKVCTSDARDIYKELKIVNETGMITEQDARAAISLSMMLIRMIDDVSRNLNYAAFKLNEELIRINGGDDDENED